MKECAGSAQDDPQTHAGQASTHQAGAPQAMHDPLSQTGQWLKSIVRGYFNYYAVPGNTASLGVFRHKLLVHWWHSVRRRSQKHRISWTRMLALAERWLPEPRVLHPFPDARFAANHPR